MTEKKDKKVLDYDPLAWLEESADEEKSSTTENGAVTENTQSQPDVKVAAKTATRVKKTAVKKTVRKKSVKKKSPSSSTAAAKKASSKNNDGLNQSPVDIHNSLEDPAAITQQEVSAMTDDKTQDPGFGFFDEEDSAVATAKVVESASADPGFGFFSEEEDEKESSKSLETDDPGYGFFTDPAEKQVVDASSDSQQNSISLGGELTIRTVTTIRELIEQSLVAGLDIKLSAKSLSKIDTAGLQLLFSLDRTLKKQSHELFWVSPSPVINEAATALGLPELIADEAEGPGYGFFNQGSDQGESGNDQENGFGFF